MTQEDLRYEISIQLDLAIQTYRDFLELGYSEIADLYYTQCKRVSVLVAEYNKNTPTFKMVVCLPHIEWIFSKI